MTKRSTQHDTFVIERVYDAPPSRVFAAWSDVKAKARWFVGPEAWEKSNHTLDFRVGGKENVSGGPPGGPVHIYNATYQDIVPNERFVLTYDMHIDKTRISVSLATVEFKAAPGGTRLIYTEQGVFLDGYDGAADRKRGTQDLLDKLEKALRA
jgi:uncharacterized protein YndB with AHSA1/START domain